MKKYLILTLLSLLVTTLYAQESTSAFTVLKLPTSVRATAEGGENVSTIDDNPALGWHNPALLANVSDNSVGLNFMTYASGTKMAGAQYVKAFGERHTGAVMMNYIGYGSIDETTTDGTDIGSFSPKDVIIGVGYSYLLSDRWSGGATLKMPYSKYADFSALALAVDLGLNYFDEDHDLSIGVTMRNCGVQLKSFDGATEHVPYALQAGFTKGIAHLPVRVNVTLTDLTKWSGKQYYTTRESGKVKVMTNIFNHISFGVDVVPAKICWIGLGYNFRRGSELKAAGSGHWAGITAGAGINVKGFRFGASYARYHMSYASLLFNAAYSF